MTSSEKKELVKIVQAKLGLKVDGDDGPVTWSTLANYPFAPIVKPEISVDDFSADALSLILKYEVGGGADYYTRYLQAPNYPGGGSGVTIGVGYDLGYKSGAQFQEDWGGKLSAADCKSLRYCIGKKGAAAKAMIPDVKYIKIPWEDAINVFKQRTLPRFIEETLEAYPMSEELDPDAFGALVSLVFNRGGSLSGSRRSEMAAIRPLVIAKDYKGIAKQIIKMKRLWVGKGLDGLLKRRDEEAALVKSCA